MKDVRRNCQCTDKVLLCGLAPQSPCPAPVPSPPPPGLPSGCCGPAGLSPALQPGDARARGAVSGAFLGCTAAAMRAPRLLASGGGHVPAVRCLRPPALPFSRCPLPLRPRRCRRQGARLSLPRRTASLPSRRCSMRAAAGAGKAGGGGDPDGVGGGVGEVGAAEVEGHVHRLPPIRPHVLDRRRLRALRRITSRARPGIAAPRLLM